MNRSRKYIRRLVLVLGDQLNRDSAVFDNFDSGRDAVWMAEVHQESTHVWTHKSRIVMFLSAMRHFRDSLREEGIRVLYTELSESDNRSTLSSALKSTLKSEHPESVVMVQAGEWRVQEAIRECVEDAKIPLEVCEDRHFYCTPEQFAEHAKSRKQLRMEFFYREMRREYSVLMDDDDPAGGQWNYDAENRKSFGKQGPGSLPWPRSCSPDETTQAVINFVEKKFARHPGSLEHFDYPVTTKDARRTLTDFVCKALPRFGDYQDAMWTDEPYLYHSRLSAAMNLKLLNPREAVEAAEQAWRDGVADLPAVEGFIRQILGWREYVRGVYWLHMPDYLERNELDTHEDLPPLYWDAKTEMHCLQQAVGQTLDYGYAHHIQRLMVTGLFALLLGVHPRKVHEWYLAVYVDAVEWVELPNTLGMSQYGDGGVMASKPYIASGKYIQRMSNYCSACRFNPAQSTGDDACPFTTLYWDFLQRHRPRLEKNQRMRMQVRNLDRKDDDELNAIRKQANGIRNAVQKGTV